MGSGGGIAWMATPNCWLRVAWALCTGNLYKAMMWLSGLYHFVSSETWMTCVTCTLLSYKTRCDTRWTIVWSSYKDEWCLVCCDMERDCQGHGRRIGIGICRPSPHCEQFDVGASSEVRQRRSMQFTQVEYYTATLPCVIFVQGATM